MPSLVELATELVVTRGKTTPLTAEEMINELNMFHAALKKLESGEAVTEEGKEETVPEAPAPPTLSLKKAFGKNEVICMICGKGGFKTLGRHLATAHGMKPREYKKQFSIPAKQSLSAKAYSESRRQMAQQRGLASNLAKAREVRRANIEAAKSAPPKAKARGKKAE